jgi:ATP-dependent DNA helicase RecG
MKPVLANVLAAIEEGAQVYVVCPAIEEDEEHSMRAAVQIYQGMEKVLGKRMRIGLLHGDMKAQEKDAVMQEFSNGNIQILVATTVIEVGINVPNATCMVIYDANRFGLSTLHQLRGRCARGDRQGVCYLLSATKDAQAKERLKKLETLTDGFAIARYDLEQRGPGDLLGTRQSGLPAFVLGDFANDPNILDAAWKDAKEIMEKRSDMAMMTYAAKACKSARYMD